MFMRFLTALAAACLLFAPAANAQGKTELLWYSQAAFKITTPGGKVIMIDPWIMGATKIPPELKDLGKIGKVGPAGMNTTRATRSSRVRPPSTRRRLARPRCR